MIDNILSLKQHNTVAFTVTASDSLKLFKCSDIHFDSLHCDRKLLKAQLDRAVSEGRMIEINGDWFDIMGCYKDPRSKAADIDPAYIKPGRSYLDLVIEDSYEFLKPYAKNILIMSLGNHEVSALKYRDTNPLARLVGLLRQDNPNIWEGDYEGYIHFKLKHENYETTRSMRNFLTRFHHGFGGNAPRSKGMLHSQIIAMQYPQVDLYQSGHTHQKFHDPSNVREMVTPSGRIYESTMHYLKLGSFKKKVTGGGFEVMRGFNRTRLGGWFCDLQFRRTEQCTFIDATFKEALPLE